MFNDIHSSTVTTKAEDWKRSKCPSTAKGNVVHPYNDMGFGFKKEGNSDTCDSTDES